MNKFSNQVSSDISTDPAPKNKFRQTIQLFKASWKGFSKKQKCQLIAVFTLILGLPTFLGGIYTVKLLSSKAYTHTNIPTSPTSLPYFENEYIRVWDSRVFPGIIDLFYKNSSGTYDQYNNIVPIARVGDIWANAEIDKATITKEIVEIDANKKVVKYQFEKLSNGAHFFILMTLLNGKREVQFKVVLNPDSSHVTAFSLGNYYGYAQLVQHIKIDNVLYNSGNYPKPNPDGNYIQGTFIKLKSPINKTVAFWGENGIIQRQTVDTPLSQQDEVIAEIRYTPWLPSQPPPEKNWFEATHITRSPFTQEKSTWRFSYELGGPYNNPTPTPTSTSTPKPTWSPWPSSRPTHTPTSKPIWTPWGSPKPTWSSWP